MSTTDDQEDLTQMVMIGIDPHKSSHTAVALDDRELELASLKLRASKGQREQLLRWAEPFETRTWAIEFALAFDVDNGEIDGVDVSGRSFVMIADTPPMMADGNWRVGVIIDDGASEEQVGKFGRVLSGELAGPPAALGPFLGEFAQRRP